MALDDAAVLTISRGHYYTAEVDTASPADLSAPGVGWTEIGHTSIEDILALASEGGEVTVLGTLQNPALKTSTTPRTETFSIILQQFNEEALQFYFGSNAVTEDGWVAVPTAPVPSQVAFLAVFTDGVNYFAFYAPKAEIARGDDMELSDTESLAGLPVAVRPLVSGSNTFPYKVYPIGPAVVPVTP